MGAHATPEAWATQGGHARAVAHEGGFHDILNDTMHRTVAREMADFVLEVT